MSWLRRVIGTFRAVWDLARELVELRDEVQAVQEAIGELQDEAQRTYERIRKRDYRERKAEEPPAAPQPPRPDVNVDRSEVIRRARATGLIR